MTNKRVLPHPDVTMTDFADESVLLHLETKTYYTLNKPGVFVWGLLKEGIPAGEIVERVRKEFSVEKEVAEKNVMDLIENLIKEKLVEVVE
jgi:hypothetical protein